MRVISNDPLLMTVCPALSSIDAKEVPAQKKYQGGFFKRGKLKPATPDWTHRLQPFALEVSWQPVGATVQCAKA